MEIKISTTVRDVFNHLNDSKNYGHILDLAEQKFLKKYSGFEYAVADSCPIGELDFEDENLSMDYLDYIDWDTLKFEQKLDFFIEFPHDEMNENQAFDFKKFFVESLQEDIDNHKNHIVKFLKKISK